MTDFFLSGLDQSSLFDTGIPDGNSSALLSEPSAPLGLSAGKPDHQLPTVQSHALLRTLNGDNQIIRGRNQTIRGTSRDDVLDGSRGRRNTIRGLGGDDTLLAGKKDRVVGGGGNDTLDAREGRGRNTLKGGGGSDELFAEKRDTLLGSGGSDRLVSLNARGRNTLNGGGGDDILVGGSNDDLRGGGGSDQFIIADGTLPSSQLQIRDFQAGVDTIGIQVDGVAQFSAITLTQQGSDTLITVNNTAVALLQGVNANALSADDFLDIENDIFSSRTGRQFSQSAQNQEDLQSQFTLHTISADGLKITDENPDPKAGVFVGAIANLQTVSGQLLTDENGNVLIDANGRALLNPNTPYIVQNTLFEEGNLEARLIYGSPIFGGRDVIQYTFFTEVKGVRTDALVRFLDFWEVGDFNDAVDDTDGFDDFPNLALPANFDVSQAINSIDYIFDNGLLGLTEFVDPTTNIPASADIILRDEFSENLSYFNVLGGQSRPGSLNTKTTFNADILNATSTPTFGATQVGETIQVQGRRQRVKGTAGADVIDGSKAKGKNKLIGKAGDDLLFSRKKDLLKGNRGNDTLDARRGKARNTLRGGGGNDTLWAKKRDQLFGNGGDDVLNSSAATARNVLNGGGGNDELLPGNNDLVSGGSGADIFWVAPGFLPTAPIIIQDFEDGVDRIGLNIEGLDPFSDLALAQQGADVLLSVRGTAIALFQNLTTTQLTSEDFIDGTQTTLAVTDIIGKRDGKQFSQTSIDETSITAQFNISNVNEDGTPIPDGAPDNVRLGVFTGAVQSYVSGSGQLTDLAAPTVQEFDPNDAIALISGVLQAEFIDDPDQNDVFAGQETIKYSILPALGEDAVVTFRVRTNAFDGFDVNQATNNLSYIVDEVFSRKGAILEDGDDFLSGSVLATRETRTYSNTDRDIAGRSFLATQFSLVDRQGSEFVTDQTPLETIGTFAKAIENYIDNVRLQSFALGNLSASLNGNTVTYTIASEDASIIQSASLDLTGTGLDPTQAVNSLTYILDNDILQRAFFPS